MGDLFVELFHVLYCSGTMCVGVTVWFGWGGVVSLCRLKQLWYDVCWCYVVVWLGWCGILMQAEAALVRCVLVLYCGLAGVVWYPDAG